MSFSDQCTRSDPSEADSAALDREARAVLHTNDRGGFTVPSGTVYPFLWNWDSAFSALGWVHMDIDRAVTELETLFRGQWDDGMVPHIQFLGDAGGYFPAADMWQCPHDPPSSGITQPPVAASVMLALWQQGDDPAIRARLRALIAPALAWHDWFLDVRQDAASGAILTVHPWETGRDNSPDWDEPLAAVPVEGLPPYERYDDTHLDAAMRPGKHDYDRYVALLLHGRACQWDAPTIARTSPFRVADVGLTAMLARAHLDLARLADAADMPDIARRLRGDLPSLHRGLESLWNEDVAAYCARDLRTGQSSGRVTSASFLPLYGADLPPERVAPLVCHMKRMVTRARYLLPSLDPDDIDFEPLRYWRGPVWAVVNLMVADGLSRHDEPMLAARLHADTRALIAGSGFWEAFSPLDGSGTGGDCFGWTAALWLHWLSDSAGASRIEESRS
ncbi:MGH1-like glycoside hydrolase domain-containing protein [Yunchengibacter salinarum]|uniref:MGH1-like glycoside hydrolase domain-containing protein n=1 Tax=Yunchengibacter salinarum TaxID=3133399 RepID=UPI0035B581E3